MQFVCVDCGKESRILERNEVLYPRDSWVDESKMVEQHRTYRCEYCDAANDVEGSPSAWRALAR